MIFVHEECLGAISSLLVFENFTTCEGCIGLEN